MVLYYKTMVNKKWYHSLNLYAQCISSSKLRFSLDFGKFQESHDHRQYAHDMSAIII